MNTCHKHFDINNLDAFYGEASQWGSLFFLVEGTCGARNVV